jgi:hypothetical protein
VKEKLLFCEQKRSKKTLFIWAGGGENARAPDSKSFLLLFSKKEGLPSYCPTPRLHQPGNGVIAGS